MAKAASPRENSLALISRIVSAIDDKKAVDIRIIDVSAQSGVTDFFVIATGTSDPHLRTIRLELERVLDEDKVKVVGVESQNDSGWTVVDAFDVIVHIFRTDQRANYQFEKLWKDGKELPLKQFLKTVERPVSDQAVALSGNSKAPEKKTAAKAPAAKKPAPKAPIVKASVRARLSGNAKLGSKQKPAPVAAEEAVAAPKAKVKQRPATEKEKKIIAKKGAKAAKLTRAIAKQKTKKVASKVPAKSKPALKVAPAKAGVVTRKAKKL